MGDPILAFSTWAADFFSWVLLALSVILCLRRTSVGYMKKFPIYCLGNCLPIVGIKFWPQQSQSIFLWFSVFELFFFTYFLGLIIQSRLLKKIAWIADFVIVAFIILLLQNRYPKRITGLVVLMESLILSVMALNYFRDVFKGPMIGDIRRDPAFWMITGILFYFVLQFPTLVFSSYLRSLGFEHAGALVYSLNNYSQFISYGLYIKAMTCTTIKVS